MPLTPDDLRNPKRKSGFDFVSVSVGGHGTGQPYRAHVYKPQSQRGTGRNSAWLGPRRATAREAAQDYCDYIASNPISPSQPRLKSAGHAGNRPVDNIPSDIEAAYGMIRDFKAQQAGKPGYVYLIVEDDGLMAYGKIGYSTNPRARVRELQTGNPRVLRLYATRLGTLEDERKLHDRHLKENVLQEWFRITPSLLAEWDDSQIIKEVAA